MWNIYMSTQAREMGITDFINPKDDERPVYEVGILYSSRFVKENTIFICMNFH